MPTFRNLTPSMTRPVKSSETSSISAPMRPNKSRKCAVIKNYGYSDDENDGDDERFSPDIGRESTSIRQQPTPAASPAPVLKPKSSKKKKGDPNHVNRPSNCYMLFRSHAIKSGMTAHLKHQADVSVFVAQAWRNADKATRERFNRQADEEKRRHSELHPDYKYAPEKKGAFIKTTPVTKEQPKRKVQPRRKPDPITPSPTPSPEVSDGEGDDYMEEDGSARGLTVKPLVPLPYVDTDVEMAIGDTIDPASDSDEEDTCEIFSEDNSPLFSMWSGKFASLPRVIPKDVKNSSAASSSSSQQTYHSTGPMSPPYSPTETHGLFPSRSISAPASRDIRQLFREARANVMLARQPTNSTERDVREGVNGWWLSTSCVPCISGLSESYMQVEETSPGFLAGASFDVEVETRLQDLSRDYFEWANSCVV